MTLSYFFFCLCGSVSCLHAGYVHGSTCQQGTGCGIEEEMFLNFPNRGSGPGVLISESSN